MRFARRNGDAAGATRPRKKLADLIRVLIVVGGSSDGGDGDGDGARPVGRERERVARSRKR